MARKNKMSKAITKVASKAQQLPEEGGNILDSLKGLLNKPGTKQTAGGLAGWMVLSKLFEAFNQKGDRGVQSEAMEAQREGMTPQSLYYQASLPQAQAEEEQARSALLTHMSGGLIGPTLAKGERLIGG